MQTIRWKIHYALSSHIPLVVTIANDCVCSKICIPILALDKTVICRETLDNSWDSLDKAGKCWETGISQNPWKWLGNAVFQTGKLVIIWDWDALQP